MNTVNYRPVFPLFPRESQSVTISLHSVYSMTASYTSVDLLLNSFAAVKKVYFFYKESLYLSAEFKFVQIFEIYD